jgi:hypothetical protein
MLYDMEYVTKPDKNGEDTVSEFLPTYVQAHMQNGVINLENVEVLR